MLLAFWGRPGYALAVGLLLMVQIAMMKIFIAQPSEKALWYSGFGVPVFVSGMMVSAFAQRSIASLMP
jgi:chlorophyll synthase